MIIVEVTRAANSFGRTHLPEIRQAYEWIAKIVADGQADGRLPRRRRPAVRLDVVLRRDRAAALRLGLRADPGRRRRLRPRQGDGRRDDLRRPRARGVDRGRASPMWESLATTRRQDRVLHGAAKVAQRRRRADRAAAVAARPAPRRARCAIAGAPRTPTRAPLPVPPPARALDGRADGRPRGDPAAPRPVADRPSCARGCRHVDLRPRPARETRGLGYSTRRQFTDHVFPGADGERIAATLALHEAPRPALIVVHGLFSTRRFDYVRQIAVAPTTSGASTSPRSTCAASGSPSSPARALDRRLEGGRGHRRASAAT